MSSFYCKTILAYGLGLIDDHQRKSLDYMRKIRNAFAHAVKPITFRTTQVYDECKKLGDHNKLTYGQPPSSVLLSKVNMSADAASPGRQFFTWVHSELLNHFVGIVNPTALHS